MIERTDKVGGAMDLDDPEWNDAWLVKEFKKGKAKPLVKYLRGSEPITPYLRGLLANIFDGKIVPEKQRRGVKSMITRTQANYFRSLFKVGRDCGWKSKDLVDMIARSLSVSNATVRDMLAKRKTYAEK